MEPQRYPIRSLGEGAFTRAREALIKNGRNIPVCTLVSVNEEVTVPFPAQDFEERKRAVAELAIMARDRDAYAVTFVCDTWTDAWHESRAERIVGGTADESELLSVSAIDDKGMEFRIATPFGIENGRLWIGAVMRDLATSTNSPALDPLREMWARTR